MNVHTRILSLFAAASAMLLFGAGCSKQYNSPTIPSGALKQPAPAAQPTKQPEIPPAAAKVPRPY